jgi:hypothetical protein
MSCFRSGIPVIFFSLVATALYVYSALPGTNWSCDKGKGTPWGKCEAGAVSLWKVKNCTDAETNPTATLSSDFVAGNFGPNTYSSAFENCSDVSKITSDNTTLECCTTTLKPSLSDFKDTSLGERDGTILGVLMGGLFSIAAFLTVILCKTRKWVLVICAFLATVFGIASIGLWIEFDKGVINKDTVINIFDGKAGMGEGFLMACGGVVANFVALLASCAVRKVDKYEFIS